MEVQPDFHDEVSYEEFLEWLHNFPPPNDKLRAAYAGYRKAIFGGDLAVKISLDPRDDVINMLVGALDECRQALTDYMDQYPHMAKGYLVDAEQHARAALKLAKAHVK